MCRPTSTLTQSDSRELQLHGLLKGASTDSDKCKEERHSHGRRTSKHAVRFASKPDVHLVSNFADLHQDHKNDIWYDKQDYQRIRVEDCQQTLLRMTSDIRHDPRQDNDGDHVFCTRGLEDKTLRGAIIRTRHIVETLTAVIEEQELQWDNCICYPERLACVACASSYRNKADALKRGQKDAEDAQSYYSQHEGSSAGKSIEK